jgi:hypothetical protein
LLHVIQYRLNGVELIGGFFKWKAIGKGGVFSLIQFKGIACLCGALAYISSS